MSYCWPDWAVVFLFHILPASEQQCWIKQADKPSLWSDGSEFPQHLYLFCKYS